MAANPKILAKTVLWTTAMLSIAFMASLAQASVSIFQTYKKKVRGTC